MRMPATLAGFAPWPPQRSFDRRARLAPLIVRLAIVVAGAALIAAGVLAPAWGADPAYVARSAPAPSVYQNPAATPGAYQPPGASGPLFQPAGAAAPSQPPRAPQPLSRETREFEVLVKGTPRGTTNFRIEQYPGRRTEVTTTAVVQMNLVVYTYTFEFNGVETWVDDHLVSFNNSGSDGGKKYALSGVVRPGQSQVVNNNKTTAGPEFVLTTNYWRLPLLRVFNETIPIIDASTGAFQKTRINRGAEDKISVGGVVIPCTEFRFSGDVDARIWLDRDGLIVRQESVESGYPTEMRLKRVVRDPVASVITR